MLSCSFVSHGDGNGSWECYQCTIDLPKLTNSADNFLTLQSPRFSHHGRIRHTPRLLRPLRPNPRRARQKAVFLSRRIAIHAPVPRLSVTLEEIWTTYTSTAPRQHPTLHKTERIPRVAGILLARHQWFRRTSLRSWRLQTIRRRNYSQFSPSSIVTRINCIRRVIF